MVHQETGKRTTVRSKNERTSRFVVLATLIVILVATVTIAVGFLVRAINTSQNPSEVSSQDSSDPEEQKTEEDKPTKIDFQSIIDNWVMSVDGNRSVIVYDPALDEIVGEFNPDEVYNTASLYKLFVVYEGYRRLENGVWNADDPAGATGRTILECLDLAIRESNSPCAETLRLKIGIEELNDIIKEDFKISNTNIGTLVSTPNDILKMMQIFYTHEEIKDETLIARMEDSFLNQPITTYNWRQGLPSGFEKANVYNKVGWDYNPNGYWNIYHDTAIVEFPDGERDFIIVVMTNKVDYQDIARFGTIFEKTFYDLISKD